MTSNPPAAAVTLFSALAVKKALDDVLLDAFTRKTGIAVDGVFDPTVALLRRIEAGERFDVMIGVAGSLGQLGRTGVVDPVSRVPIARTGVGVAMPHDRQGPPDISTKDALVATLLAARSVAYSRTGASGIYFAELIQRLGIADQVNSRATVIEKGFIADAVVDGRADLAIQQMSELLFVPEARIVGPLPDEVQHYTRFAAAVSTDAAENPHAMALVDFLSGPLASAAYARTLLDVPN